MSFSNQLITSLLPVIQFVICSVTCDKGGIYFHLDFVAINISGINTRVHYSCIYDSIGIYFHQIFFFFNTINTETTNRTTDPITNGKK